MANHLYSLYKSTARSTVDTPSYYPDHPSSSSSLYSSLSSDYPSYSRLRSIDLPTSTTTTATTTTTIPSSSFWPSFDLSSSSYTKRPSQVLYDQPILHAHMIGQNEAWLTSESLAKRPKLESAINLPYYPQRPGEKDCTHYMLTRTCKYGDNCKFDHPIWVPAGGIPDWKEPPSIPSESHPERPGEPDCPYFLKTQKCKFGLKCKFNHPKDKLDPSGKIDAVDLPERPSEPLCSFYMKTGICKFRASCKYHHPKDIQVPSDGQEAVDGAQSHSVDNSSVTADGTTVKAVSNSAHSYNSKGLPIRLGEVDCPFYMKTGSCKYGVNCRYNHPDWNVINPAASVVGHAVLPSLANNVGIVNQAASILQSLQPGFAQTTFGRVPAIYPQRPGQTECDYYMKSGECKFGERCRFHHPIDRFALTKNLSLEQNVKLTLAGLPRREGVQHCPFYMKTGTCSYGVNCKFDHPPPGEVMASTGKETPTKAEEEGKENGEEGKKNEDNGNGNDEKSEDPTADK